MVAGGAVSNLALVIYEFAANAAKYGALSQPGGTVNLTWQTDGARLTLSWEEQGGPPVAGTPPTTGFGSLLSRRCWQANANLSLVCGHRMWPIQG